MKKQTKIILAAIAAVLLLVGLGFWAYMSADVSLDTILPQDQWNDVSITAIVFEDGQTQHKIYTGEGSVSGQIKQTLNAAQAERTRSFDDMKANILWIVFWTGETHDMWNLALGEDGLLRITSPDYRTYYFENCQELYLQLQAIAENLPLAE